MISKIKYKGIETHHKNRANLQVCSSAWDAFSNRLMNESGVTQQMSNFKT